MSTWKTASLGEIFEIARGGSPRPIQDYLTDDPNGVNWISISDASASSKFITTTKKRIRPEGVSRSRMVKPGDFLLTNSMSFGRPYIMGTNGCIHDGWLVLSSKHDEVDQDYFFQLLSSDFIYAKFSKLAAGATVKNLNIDLVSGVEVTFPPLEEQRRIAAILDQAETLRTQRRTALALLDSLTQSLFLDMFGDPAINQKGWEVKTIEELCEVKGGKRLPKGAEYSPTPTPHRYIRVTNLSNGQVDQSQLLYLTPEIQKSIGRYIVNTGDVIISIAGSIGLVAPVPASLDGANLTENAAKLVQRRDGNYLPDFLAFMLGTKAIQDQIQSHVGQVTIGKLALFRIEKLTIPLPPLPLQQTFATRIASIEALKATHRRALAALDALFASLQQRAFAGAL